MSCFIYLDSNLLAIYTNCKIIKFKNLQLLKQLMQNLELYYNK